MPRSIKPYLAKDVLARMDEQIYSVCVSDNMLIMYDVDNNYFRFDEQDLVTLLEFLRSNLH